MRVIVRLQYWMKIVQYLLFVHLNYSVLHVYSESCVCVCFSMLVLLNALELRVASILLNKYTWVALGCFSHMSYHCAVIMIITVFVQAIQSSLLDVGSTC